MINHNKYEAYKSCCASNSKNDDGIITSSKLCQEQIIEAIWGSGLNKHVAKININKDRTSLIKSKGRL